MLPFRSGDPEPGGGSRHLGLDSVEFRGLLSAFPHTAVSRLLLKIYNAGVCVGIYFSTCISAGFSCPSGSDLTLFHAGTLPASLGYHLP